VRRRTIHRGALAEQAFVTSIDLSDAVAAKCSQFSAWPDASYSPSRHCGFALRATAVRCRYVFGRSPTSAEPGNRYCAVVQPGASRWMAGNRPLHTSRPPRIQFAQAFIPRLAEAPADTKALTDRRSDGKHVSTSPSGSAQYLPGVVSSLPCVANRDVLPNTPGIIRAAAARICST
jgi:hypothetical protein